MSWVLASFLLLGCALAIGFAWYERSHPSARVLALVATLAALAALGRIAFAPIPNVKPTTDIVLLTGYVLGGAPGFMVGAVAALASNLFFGQGPWTPWQMAGWGIAGLIGAGLARVWGRELGRVPLALACAGASLVYGAVQNLSLWITFSGDHSLAKLWFYVAGSFAFDVAHALGSLLFCLAFGPALVRALQRFRTRFEVTWHPAPAALVGGAARARGRRPAAARRRRRPQGPDPLPRARPERRRRLRARAARRLDPDAHGLGRARARGRGEEPARRRPRRQQRDRLHERERRQAPRRPRRALADDPRPARRRPARGAARRPRPRRGDRARAGAGRVVRRAREHDGVRGARAARGRPRHGRPGGEARGDVHRRPGQPRRRLQLRREGRAVGRRRHRRRPAGARRGGPPRLAGRAPGGALAGPPPERRRRLLAPGRSEQRAVDGVGGPGAGRRGPQPVPCASPRLAQPDRVPAVAHRPGRRDPLLAHQRSDAGLGHRAGADGARGEGAADRAGAARAPRGGSDRARRDARAGGHPGGEAAAAAEPVSAPAAVAVPPPAAPRLTPLAAVAVALPAATPRSARTAGVLAAMVTRSLLP